MRQERMNQARDAERAEINRQRDAERAEKAAKEFEEDKTRLLNENPYIKTNHEKAIISMSRTKQRKTFAS
jgi:hypothetical protein